LLDRPIFREGRPVNNLASSVRGFTPTNYLITKMDILFWVIDQVQFATHKPTPASRSIPPLLAVSLLHSFRGATMRVRGR